MVIKVCKKLFGIFEKPDAEAMKKLIHCVKLCLLLVVLLFTDLVQVRSQHLRILVVTGGHDYDTVAFSDMFDSMQDVLTFSVLSFPEAFRSFKPEHRQEFDAVILYHMWQNITPEQEQNLAGCIGEGKPMVVLHHSICAFDDWEEYRKITGGRYFHRPDTIDGRIYPVSGYEHGVRVKVHIADNTHPVTKGMTDTELLDETYADFYVEPGVTTLLTTGTPGSSPVVGWAKTYGRARVVTLQPGHDARTFENPWFREILLRAILWVCDSDEIN
jgi:uncharacterized protein